MPRNIESGPSTEPDEVALQKQINEKVEQEDAATRGKNFSDPRRDAEEMANAREKVDFVYGGQSPESRQKTERVNRTLDEMNNAVRERKEALEKRNPPKEVQNNKAKPWWKKLLGQK